MVVGSHGGGGGFHGGGSGSDTIYRASEKERKDTTGDVVEAHRLAKHSRALGNSPLVRASIVMPLVGYLILLNQSLTKVDIKLQLDFLQNPWRLLLSTMDFFGLLSRR